MQLPRMAKCGVIQLELSGSEHSVVWIQEMVSSILRFTGVGFERFKFGEQKGRHAVYVECR